MPNLIGFAFAALILACSAGAGRAEAPTSTLQAIAEKGVIRIGYGAENIPFSYKTADGQVIGYSIDLCLRVVDTLKERLNLKSIAVEFVERTPSNRVAMLRDGQFDIECVSSTNNAERRKSVAFSRSHFVAATQYLSLKESNLKSIDDLAGHTVAATSGTINIGQLNTVNRERNLHIAVLPVENHRTALKLVTEGRASAFVMDGVLLAAMVANSENPDLYALSTGILGTPEPYGFMVRHDDHEFRDAVNEALLKIFSSSEIETIYNKWFTAPIPPNGINMRMPMAAELRAAFASPSEN